MSEVECPKCNYIAPCPAKLQNHLNNKKPCNVGKYRCQNCRYRTNDSGNMSRHRKTCKGPPEKSKKCLQQENEDLKTIIAATGPQRTNETQVSNITNTVIHGDQINNIQNTTVVVMPAFQENISHIKKLSVHELQSMIGFGPDISTHVKFFNMIRTDEAHPENHTMLLPSQDAKNIHYKKEDGWVEGKCDEQLHRALFTDNRTLIQDFARIEKTHPEFYNRHLLQTVNQMINNNDHVSLQPYYAALREELHAFTMSLVRKNADSSTNELETQASEPLNASSSQASVTDIDKLLQLEAMKLKSLEISSKNLEIESKNLEMQLRLKGL